MQNIAIKVDGAAYSYRREADFALHPTSIAVPRGGRLVLVGSNGAGKSTLLRLIAGRSRPHSGSVTVLGEPAFECTRLALQITYVGSEWDESYNVPVRQLLARAAQQVEAGRATKLLVALGLDASLLSKDLATVSSGQRHRVQVLDAPPVFLCCQADFQTLCAVTLLSVAASGGDSIGRSDQHPRYSIQVTRP